MVEFFLNTVKPNFNYWVYVILMMVGLWSLIAKNNLIKKIMGLAIFQTAIILFYVSLGVKDGATIPVLEQVPVEAAGTVAAASTAGAFADGFANPVPHVLMLTAIVVGVATLGVALALCQTIFKEFDTLEEDELLRKIKALPDDV
ncbi:MAG: cation:proton antiporter subunit C [Verrucomicrobiaceae bacterium]|nr:cation:proton antiporter subunit C [Verrucomicrobiaceae bacterium]